MIGDIIVKDVSYGTLLVAAGKVIIVPSAKERNVRRRSCTLVVSGAGDVLFMFDNLPSVTGGLIVKGNGGVLEIELGHDNLCYQGVITAEAQAATAIYGVEETYATS